MMETEAMVRKLDKDVALLNQRLDTIQNNHLEHLDQKVNLILKIVSTVGVLITAQVLNVLFNYFI